MADSVCFAPLLVVALVAQFTFSCGKRLPACEAKKTNSERETCVIVASRCPKWQMAV